MTVTTGDTRNTAGNLDAGTSTSPNQSDNVPTYTANKVTSQWRGNTGTLASVSPSQNPFGNIIYNTYNSTEPVRTVYQVIDRTQNNVKINKIC